MSHQGEILQDAIKSSGISITHLVEALGITRPTIYRKFKEATLDYSFVKRVGDVIGHDFSADFTPQQQRSLPLTVTHVTQSGNVTPDKPVTPKAVSSHPLEADTQKQLMQLQQKYIALLEAYNDLLLRVYAPK